MRQRIPLVGLRKWALQGSGFSGVPPSWYCPSCHAGSVMQVVMRDMRYGEGLAPREERWRTLIFASFMADGVGPKPRRCGSREAPGA